MPNARESTTPQQEIDQLLRSAISRRRLIRFWYDDRERISEPHDYGVQNGKVRLLTYQIGGASNTGRLPAWRWIDVEKVPAIEVLDRVFAGRRDAPSGQHHKWDVVFARVDEEQTE